MFARTRNAPYQVVLGLLLVAACATTEGYEKILNGLVGTHIDDLVRSWGPPAGTHTFKDGSRVVKFSSRRIVTMPGSWRRRPILIPAPGGGTRTEYVEERSLPSTDVYRCDTTFDVDKAGIIQGWRHEGNDCVAIAR